MQWFRMWVDAIDDEKLKLLAFEDRWHYVAILCMKRKGMLDVDESEPLRDRKVGVKLGLGDRERDEARRRLIDVDLVDEQWQPKGWSKRQFVSDADPTSTQRKQKQRDRERHAPVTRDDSDSHAPVTGKSRTSHTAQSQKQITDTDSEKTKNPSASATPTQVDEPEWFSDFKAVYPPRAGDQGWRKAMKAGQARIGEGHSPVDLLAGARRYAEFCRATQKIGTEFVKQAATFLGPDKPFLQPWHMPSTKADIRLAGNLTAAQEFMRRTEPTQ